MIIDPAVLRGILIGLAVLMTLVFPAGQYFLARKGPAAYLLPVLLLLLFIPVLLFYYGILFPLEGGSYASENNVIGLALAFWLLFTLLLTLGIWALRLRSDPENKEEER
ncbi:MAG: hypothetical protein ILP12_05650 [Lachnospiraceae bacterium]|nr:hypothetical protein [Lachnospiraceae bacterium]